MSGGRESLKVFLRTVALAITGLCLVLVAWVSFWSFYDSEPEVPPPLRYQFLSKNQGESSSVLFLGDFAPTDAALPYLEKNGFGYPFSKTKDLLEFSDVVIANLEAPVTSSDKPWPLPKKYIYKVDPTALKSVKSAGIDVVSLANNHIKDYGDTGLADTLHNLDIAGIGRLGAGLSEKEARQGAIIGTSGGKLGVLAYMEDKVGWRLWSYSFALDTPFKSWPGAARFRYSNFSRDLRRLKKDADIVAVTIHWGMNYKPITARQRIIAKGAIDLGADVVIGHHPHQYQPIGMYKGKPIVYSIGNYAFGTIGRSSMRYGLAAALNLAMGRLVSMEFTPLLTQNRIVKYCTRVPRGNELGNILNRITKESLKEGAGLKQIGDSLHLDLTQ